MPTSGNRSWPWLTLRAETGPEGLVWRLLRLLREIWWYMRLKCYVGVRRSFLIDWRTDWASQRPQICAQTNPFPNADWSSA